MEAVVGGAAPFDAQCGIFTPGTEHGQRRGHGDAERQALDLASLKAELKAAGYAGEKVVYLEPTDVPRINAIAEVGADMLRKIGMNVDVIATDWGTTVQRSVSRQPPEKGGWHMFAAFSGGYDMALARDPSAGARQRRPGRITAGRRLPKLEAIRDQWLDGT